MAAQNRKGHLFTSESVSMGHPDKVSDQVSDAVLDSLLAHDPKARVACETLCTTGLVVVAGEVTVHNHEAEIALGGIEKVVRGVIKDIGYDDPTVGFHYDSCAVVRTIHGQSADISQGVTAETNKDKDVGAGDQGLMFGFACTETKNLMPLPIHLSHRILERLTDARRGGEIRWLRPDAKSQVTIEYADGKPRRVHTIVCSTQHVDGPDVIGADGNMHDRARQELIDKVIKPAVVAENPALWNGDIKFHINPTGRFVIGGPHGDTGLTGRKIIVDTYGGRGRHGGGAFSGKDPTKVDRSACYMARHVAKNVVAAGLAEVCEVQVSYAIGVARPTSILVSTEGTVHPKLTEDRLSDIVTEVFADLFKPRNIIEYLKLARPIYRKTAYHGHFGRNDPDFAWESTHRAAELAKLAGVEFKG